MTIRAKPIKSFASRNGKVSGVVAEGVYKCPCGQSAVAVKVKKGGRSHIFCPFCSQKYSDKFELINGYLVFEEI